MVDESKDLEWVHPILSEDELKLLLSPDQLHRIGLGQAVAKQSMVQRDSLLAGDASLYDQIQLLQQQVSTLIERIGRLEHQLAMRENTAAGENRDGAAFDSDGRDASLRSAAMVAAQASQLGAEFPAAPHAAALEGASISVSETDSSEPTPSRLDTYGRRKKRT